jgi:hypothetical protein
MVDAVLRDADWSIKALHAPVQNLLRIETLNCSQHHPFGAIEA